VIPSEEPTALPTTNQPTSYPTAEPLIVTWNSYQILNSRGLTADAFNADENAQYVFKTSVASTMPGVYPDEVAINVVESRTIAVADDDALGFRRLETIIPAGIGIDYNITTKIERFNYEDAKEAYEDLATKLVSAIQSGSFEAALVDMIEAFEVTSMPNVTSGATDLIRVREYATTTSVVVTNAPTSTPSLQPDESVQEPTTDDGSDEPLGYVEIGAGITLTAAIFGVWYFSSMVLGLLRPKVSLQSSKDTKGSLDQLHEKKTAGIVAKPGSPSFSPMKPPPSPKGGTTGRVLANSFDAEDSGTVIIDVKDSVPEERPRAPFKETIARWLETTSDVGSSRKSTPRRSDAGSENSSNVSIIVDLPAPRACNLKEIEEN
jgi:hypothetical protein